MKGFRVWGLGLRCLVLGVWGFTGFSFIFLHKLNKLNYMVCGVCTSADYRAYLVSKTRVLSTFAFLRLPETTCLKGSFSGVLSVGFCWRRHAQVLGLHCLGLEFGRVGLKREQGFGLAVGCLGDWESWA